MKIIPLTQGYEAIVDDEAFETLSRFKWCANKVGRRVYARRTVRGPDGKVTRQYLHKVLLPFASYVDHKDGNSLNDRLENLRSASVVQNNRGFKTKRLLALSKYRGVSWDSARGKWVAQIHVNKKRLWLGRFEYEVEAAKAYDVAAIKYFGEFASPNFKHV